MNVAFRDNLGSQDARRFGLDYRYCTKGAVAIVSDETGAALVQSGFATEIASEPKPVVMEMATDEPISVDEPSEPEKPRMRRKR